MPQPRDFKIFKKDGVIHDMQNERLGFLFASHRTQSGQKVTTTRKALHALDVIFQNVTVCNFCLKKNVLFSVKREMPILFFVNCERGVLFSVKCNQDPPLPPSCNSNFFTVMTDIKLHYNYNYNSPFILGR